MPYLLSLILLVVLSTQASAQSAGSPAFMAGDEWKFSYGLTQSVIKVDGDVTAMKGVGNCPTCVRYFDKNLTIMKVEQADGTPPDSLAVDSFQSGPTGSCSTFRSRSARSGTSEPRGSSGTT